MFGDVMNALTGKEKIYLRSLAHSLDPVVFIGAAGVSREVVAELLQRLNQQELIKVRFVDHKDEKKSLAMDLAKAAKAHLAGLVGNVAILYRQHPDPECRVIALPSRKAKSATPGS